MTVNRSSFVIGTHAPRMLLALCGLLGACALALPAVATASGRRSTKLVRYEGWRARVPAAWPVFRLARDPHTCVRFNRHAVYLGRPGAAELCPGHAVGRTEAILVTPRAGASGADVLPAPSAGASGGAIAGGGAVAQVARPAQGVVVTATWNRDPGAVRSALGMRSVRSVIGAARAYARSETRSARHLFQLSLRGDRAATNSTGADVTPPTTTTTTTTTTTSTTPTTPTSTTTPVTPGGVYTGLGFDACSTPSLATMSAWSSSPFRALGVYIGGPEMACAQPNLTASWVATQAAAGWHLIPIYVGLQAPTNGCGCAAISPASASAQGTETAQGAIQEAQAIGLGAGNPIYDDMENYTRTAASSAAVLAYIGGWTTELHLAGYKSGVYSSELSGIEDLVAAQGTGYTEPDDIWIANWNGQASTADPQVPSTEWADHQRLHQYQGAHDDDYGGTTINIDSDYVDAATAAPGTGTTLTTTIAAAPTMATRPVDGDGSLELTPSWGGEAGVVQWRYLGGATPTSLSTVLTVPASRKISILHTGDGYFQVQGIGSAGQVLGTSGTDVVAPHVAIFGRSAFVGAHGPGGLPVECFAIDGCRITTTMWHGRRALVRAGYSRVSAGGGVVHFPVSPALHRLVAAAGDAGLVVTVTVRTSTGRRATRVIKLIPFTVTGAGPRRITHASSGAAMRILGGTDFVSHGWTGGVLVACPQPTACTGTPSVTVRGHVIATAHTQTISAEEVGYLSFQMTKGGHALLRRARGNQLGATVTVRTPAEGLAMGGTASAFVSLDSF